MTFPSEPGVDDSYVESPNDQSPGRRSDRDSGRDWAWIEEWRASDEPTPWGPGLVISGFVALVVAVAVHVITVGLSDRPIFALIANIVVAVGLGPALWLSRNLPVLRWVSLGGVVGVVIAWITVLLFPV